MQIIPNGLVLGSPGPIGSAPILIFGDAGDPNTIFDVNGLLKSCALGSTFQRTDPPDSGHGFYVKTAQPTSSAPNGVWTAK